MKLSPRITTVASSAVANLCLIPETGGRRWGEEGEEEEEGDGGVGVCTDRKRSKVKAPGKNGETHAAESNQCAVTKARGEAR